MQAHPRQGYGPTSATAQRPAASYSTTATEPATGDGWSTSREARRIAPLTMHAVTQVPAQRSFGEKSGRPIRDVRSPTCAATG